MMIDITRKIGENIIIGDSIKCTILNANSNQVKLGIEAPNNITVHRQEIYDKIQRQMNGEDDDE